MSTKLEPPVWSLQWMARNDKYVAIWHTQDTAFTNLKSTMIYLITQDSFGIDDLQKESMYSGSTGQWEITWGFGWQMIGGWNETVWHGVIPHVRETWGINPILQPNHTFISNNQSEGLFLVLNFHRPTGHLMNRTGQTAMQEWENMLPIINANDWSFSCEIIINLKRCYCDHWSRVTQLSPLEIVFQEQLLQSPFWMEFSMGSLSRSYRRSLQWSVATESPMPIVAWLTKHHKT